MFPGGYGNDVVIHTKETEIHYPTSSTTASIISVTAVGMQGGELIFAYLFIGFLLFSLLAFSCVLVVLLCV
tara:strand:- start:1278 stop:1490 length:213 start_codon:yes stop_codon:yes gene_type:complete